VAAKACVTVQQAVRARVATAAIKIFTVDLSQAQTRLPARSLADTSGSRFP
jgi:hypothetical protein